MDISEYLTEIAICLLELQTATKGRYGEYSASHALDLVHEAQMKLMYESQRSNLEDALKRSLEARQ